MKLPLRERITWITMRGGKLDGFTAIKSGESAYDINGETCNAEQISEHPGPNSGELVFPDNDDPGSPLFKLVPKSNTPQSMNQ